MSLQYEVLEGVPEDSVLNTMAALVAVIFHDGPLHLEALEQHYQSNKIPIPWVDELKQYSKVMTVCCFDHDKLVGFKLGYQSKLKEFYSWLGGVRPDYRNQGIASELMKIQHSWCKDQGYTFVRTETMNRFRNMLILNLRHGYDVIGSSTTREGDIKIILEKTLIEKK